MSRHITRQDKTCLNCRHVVQERFCPNCGQENIDSRKTFYELFIHFFEDLTHYENAFWRTIRNLLLKPASLTIEYLSGKRISYLAPVRLYIFISFITFFLLSVMPDLNQIKNVKKNSSDSIPKSVTAAKQEKMDRYKDLFQFGYKSMEEVDSIQKHALPEDRRDATEYWLVKKAFAVTKDKTTEEIIEKFKESFSHDFPKTIFLYMPIFAFFLWLFHDKRRWYYFDHGIFTLHYFSFLLLTVLIIFLYRKLFSIFPSHPVIEFIETILNFFAYGWMFYYFFPAHHRFYQESRLVSGLKSIGLFVINITLILFILTFFAIYTFLNIQ